MGSFLPLLQPYVDEVRVWISPPTRALNTNSWVHHFYGTWRDARTERPAHGHANYISDKLAETSVLFRRKIEGNFAMLSRPIDTGHTPFGDIFYSTSLWLRRHRDRTRLHAGRRTPVLHQRELRALILRSAGLRQGVVEEPIADA